MQFCFTSLVLLLYNLIYLLKEYNLPIGGTYIHNGVSFDNKNKQFGLYIKLSGNDPSVDVIIL